MKKKIKIGSIGSAIISSYRYEESPLTYLLRREDEKEKREKMAYLQQFLYENLPPLQSLFLVSKLGSKWEGHKPPRCLTGLDLDDIEEFMKNRLPTIKERLEILINIVRDYNRAEAVMEYINTPYSLMTHDEVVDFYKGILQNGSRFRSEFFKCDKERKGRIILRYLFDEFLGVKKEDILKTADNNFFKRYKIKKLLKECFDGNIRYAVSTAYPTEEYPEVYKHLSPAKPREKKVLPARYETIGTMDKKMAVRKGMILDDFVDAMLNGG